MKTRAELKPVAHAIDNFEDLIRQYASKRSTPLPAERELAKRWNLSASAVNRAATQLIGAGRLRRDGYKLHVVPGDAGMISGAVVSVITHRADRMPGIVEEGAMRSIKVSENFFVGRDSLRNQLRRAIDARVDGIIMSQSDSGWEWDAEMAELARLNIPCIICEEAPAGISLVAEDWKGAAAMLTEHLLALGHRSIVCVGSLRRKVRSGVVCNGFAETLLRRGMEQCSRQIVLLNSHTRQGIAVTLKKIRTQYPDATALLFFDVDSIRNVSLALHDVRIVVPADISLAVVGDNIDARSAMPSLTCAAFDQKLHSHIILDLMARQIASARHWGRILNQPRIRIEATLRAGSSAQPLRGAETDSALDSSPKPHTWPTDKEERRRAVEATWMGTHEAAKGASQADFQPLDLRSVVNRSLHRPHGWLGHLPLQNLPPGRRTIHGVPFDLIDEAGNDGRAALVMQSSRGLPAGRSSLPSKAVLPVNAKVRAVYFLHGCGFAADATPFAWYDFTYADHKSCSLTLVPLGITPASPDAMACPAPNIQDWWADFPQFDAPHVRHLVLTGNGDPHEYERYLYTLEWVNDRPDIPLQSIGIRTDTNEPTTLGVLAVTILTV
jgi:DNA-binding LacI/PurR family transcriptional regulator